MSVRLRVATLADAPAIRAIYAPFVTGTAISFEESVPSEAEIAERIRATLERFPWLVAESEAGVLGYAYAGQHRKRASYRWAVDVSVYLAPEARGQGLGKRLYRALLKVLRAQGYAEAFGGVSLPNPASVGLHESLGFEPIGVYRRVGFKQGAWHDVGWWQLSLQTLGESPPEPTLFSELPPSVE